jgi:VWFA-related protein
MEKLARETGGRVIEAGSNPEKMREAFDRISQELRSQYSIGYSPTNAAQDGSFRKVEIKTDAGKVQARKGYYATK